MVQNREGTKEKKAKLCKESQSGRVVKTNGLPFLLFFFFSFKWSNRPGRIGVPVLPMAIVEFGLYCT